MLVVLKRTEVIETEDLLSKGKKKKVFSNRSILLYVKE